MRSFAGFSNADDRAIPVPLEFFTHLLSKIEDLGVLKVTLYVFWHISHQESRIRYVRQQDFIEDKLFISGFPGNFQEKEKAVKDSLLKAVEQGILIATNETTASETRVFFLNSKEGRAALNAYQKQFWTNEQGTAQVIALDAERPNIFRLYEENIGPLTPLIAETLRDAEETYSVEWIRDAIIAAVKNNVRRWKYVEAILNRWKEEGRNEKDRRDHREDRKKFIQGEYGDLVKR